MSKHSDQIKSIRSKYVCRLEKLKDEEVKELALVYERIILRNLEIRELRSSGFWSYGRLSKQFGLSPTRVRQVVLMEK